MEPEIPIDRFEIFATGLDHPECCAFDRDGNLWAGGEAGQLYRIDPSGKVETIANLGGFCCGIALSPDDRELFVCVSGVGVVRVSKNGEHRVFATHAGNHKIVAPNYLLFDRSGRLYVTDSGNWMKQNGFVLRFTPDGRGEVLAGPFGYANGLALSADERHLFMVESDSDSILRFEIGSDDRLHPPEKYAEHVGRFPDGLALDVSRQSLRLLLCVRRDLANQSRWAKVAAGPRSLGHSARPTDKPRLRRRKLRRNLRRQPRPLYDHSSQHRTSRPTIGEPAEAIRLH